MCVMCLPIKQKMSDREWMYTGRHTDRHMTPEWLTKMGGFLEHAFASGVGRTWCPVVFVGTRDHAERRRWENTWLRMGLCLAITFGPTMVSPNVAERRWGESAPTTMIPGSET